MDTIDQLIEILFDKTASISERDDAAMDLGNYNDDRALKALIKAASNPTEEDIIADSCGESIAEIWDKRNKFDVDSYKRFHPYAKLEVELYIKGKKTEWLKFLKTS